MFADAHGSVVHLFERDCSLQRRHQKVIEEAPAPGMTPEVRESVCASAVAAARAVGYRGAGTVEFIADASEGLRADRIWFMEMNTRLQVEHPVTEAITGLDLVEWQIRVASGEPLPLRQEEITMGGWAMEARLYAENPATGFLPSTGRLEHFRLPGPRTGVRVDSGVQEGGEVTPFYDPMIAKLIVHEQTRKAAAASLAAACAGVEVWPVRTNAGFLARCASEADFVAGRVDTGFIPSRLEALATAPAPSDESVQAYAFERLQEVRRAMGDRGPVDNSALTGFRLNSLPVTTVPVWIGGERREAILAVPSVPSAWSARDDALFEGGEAYAAAPGPPLAQGAGMVAGDGKLTAPMPGRVVSLSVVAGQRVAKGAAVVTLEAMKMEHGLTAPFDAIVAEAPVAVGQQVSEGALLVRLEREAGGSVA